jgi:hypothetical protein
MASIERAIDVRMQSMFEKAVYDSKDFGCALQTATFLLVISHLNVVFLERTEPHVLADIEHRHCGINQ